MYDILKSILINVLSALYQYSGCSLLLAVLFMFLYLYAAEHGEGFSGWKYSLQKWWSVFKAERRFRRAFVLAFYTAMILFRTLFNRSLWMNPLSDIMGGWGLENSRGEFSTEAIENFILFIPFTLLLSWTFRDRLLGKDLEAKLDEEEKKLFKKVMIILWKVTKITFLFSLSIEFTQLLLHLGTFQFADLFYNTFGGLTGGIIYLISERISRFFKKI